MVIVSFCRDLGSQIGLARVDWPKTAIVELPFEACWHHVWNHCYFREYLGKLYFKNYKNPYSSAINSRDISYTQRMFILLWAQVCILANSPMYVIHVMQWSLQNVCNIDKCNNNFPTQYFDYFCSKALLCRWRMFISICKLTKISWSLLI